MDVKFSQIPKPDKDHFNVNNFSKINSNELLDSRDPEIDLNDQLNSELENRQKDPEIPLIETHFEETQDKPKTFIREFLLEERNRQKDLHLKKIKESIEKEEIKTPKTRSRKGKCYTCHPRKKVKEHIIRDQNGITFHHDMCNRNMVIVTPNRHYLTFQDIPLDEVGIIFKEIDEFCRSWNIIDYNVNYNQGEWQTHKHFHLKIKSYDTVIRRMRGDHFRMLALQKKYN